MLSHLPLDEQVSLLMRGVSFGDSQTEETMAAELRERLGESRASGHPLRVYLGVDPTSSDLHLGHTVPLRKLRQFQELGHQAIFLIGSFTARIGDPSDKDAARAKRTRDQVQADDIGSQCDQPDQHHVCGLRFTAENRSAADIERDDQRQRHLEIATDVRGANFAAGSSANSVKPYSVDHGICQHIQ